MLWKLLLLPLLVLFFNLGFILLAVEAYSSLQTLVPIILLNAIVCFDIVIRPSSSRQDEYNRAVVAISFILMPAMLVAPHLEEKTLAWIRTGSGLSILIATLGVVLVLVGGTADHLPRAEDESSSLWFLESTDKTGELLRVELDIQHRRRYLVKVKRLIENHRGNNILNLGCGSGFSRTTISSVDMSILTF